MVTLVTTFVYCAAAFLERVRAGDVVRKGSWTDYVFLAVLTSSGMYMTNAALRYLNYTTRIVAKSSKVIPTMILGTLMQGRRYGYAEYAAASTLVLGIALFTMGDVDTLPSFHPKGVVLIVAALFVDSAAGNFEERILQRPGSRLARRGGLPRQSHRRGVHRGRHAVQRRTVPRHRTRVDPRRRAPGGVFLRRVRVYQRVVHPAAHPPLGREQHGDRQVHA